METQPSARMHQTALVSVASVWSSLSPSTERAIRVESRVSSLPACEVPHGGIERDLVKGAYGPYV